MRLASCRNLLKQTIPDTQDGFDGQDVDIERQKPVTCHKRARWHPTLLLFLTRPKGLTGRHPVPHKWMSFRDQMHQHILINIRSFHRHIINIRWQDLCDQGHKRPKGLFFAHEEKQDARDIIQGLAVSDRG